jgi:hypothetical protein
MICKDCWEEFQPWSINQVSCKRCSANSIESLVDKLISVNKKSLTWNNLVSNYNKKCNTENTVT